VRKTLSTDRETLVTEYKSLLIAKNIADATFVLAISLYLACHLLLLLLEKNISFFETLAVILYGGLSVVVFSVISLIARAIFLYKNSTARNNAQKTLLLVSAIPLGSLLLQALGLL
jgi:hypothetical protein